MKKDLISVIVCIYNREKFLEKCISSIIDQTYYNLEIVLLNDGSTDNSLNICKKYEKIDKRIKVYNQSNHGIAYSRNKGIELSNGEYVCFVDSDDWIDKNYCKHLYDNIKKYDADLAICDILEIDKESKNLISTEEKTKFFNKNLLNLLFSNYRIINPINKLYKKNILKKCKYPVGTVHEDTYIIYDILKNSNSIIYINEPLYNRNIHGESIMSTNNLDRLNEITAYEHWMKNFYDENDITNYNLAIVKVLKSIIRNYTFLSKKITKNTKMELLKKYKNYYNKISIKLSYKDYLKLKSFYLFPKITSTLNKLSKLKKTNK